MYVCMYVYIYMYGHVYIYIHTYVHFMSIEILYHPINVQVASVKQQVQMLSDDFCEKLPPASTGAHASKHIRHVSMKLKDLGQSSPSEAPNAFSSTKRNTQAPKLSAKNERIFV